MTVTLIKKDLTSRYRLCKMKLNFNIVDHLDEDTVVSIGVEQEFGYE